MTDDHETNPLGIPAEKAPNPRRLEETTDLSAPFGEAATVYRQARLSLGWSQELFAEKALVAVSTIRVAEAGRRISARSHRSLVDAINKGRLSAIPPQSLLTLPFPGMASPNPEESPESEEARPPVEVPEDPLKGAKRFKELRGKPPETPPPIPPKNPPRLVWDDNEGVATLASDRWTIRDALEGTMIFGATGSGKTSGSGQTFALGYLAHGFGGLVLCAKPDETERWARYAAHTGRSDDIVFFGRDPRLAFNFLAHEAAIESSGGNLTENLVTLFTEIASIGAGATAGKAADPFWERAMRSLVRNAIELLVQAGEEITLHDLFDVIRSAPTTPQQVQDENWRRLSPCWKMILTARARVANTLNEVDIAEVASFWLEQFPALGDRTRSSVVATFTTLAEGLMRGKMRELFCSETTIAPEALLSGKIVVVDLPIKEWGEVGRIAGVLWKYCTQKAIERRSDNKGGQARPVFIWVDECRYFLSRNDDLFQATARSARAATVYLTQSIASLVASIGGESNSRAVVDSLINNLGTKVFHSNGDPTTNDYAANLVGKRLTKFENSSSSRSWSLKQSSITTSRGHSTQYEYTWRPEYFLQLRKGGPSNAFQVTGIVVQTGRVWGPERLPYAHISFDQRIEKEPPPLPLPKKSPGMVATLFFPWLGPKKGWWIRWPIAAVLWFVCLGIADGILFPARPSQPIPREGQESTSPAENKVGSVAGVASPPVPLVPIPVDVDFLTDARGESGFATFSTTLNERLPITVMLTSHATGKIKEFNFQVSPFLSPTTNSFTDPLAPGDEIQVSNPRFKPITVVYHAASLITTPSATKVDATAPAVTATPPSTNLLPIPVDVEFLTDSRGENGYAKFTTGFDGILWIAVTSHPSGKVREFNFRASPVISSAIDPYSGALEPGDEIEVSNPHFKPLTVVYRSASAHS